MKIVLVQGRRSADRPVDNLEHIKATLKREELKEADVVVFPALMLSGPLGPEALARPGLDAQYHKVWDDFLALTREYPRSAVVSTILTPADGRIREEAFAVKAGQVLLRAGGEAGQLAFETAGGKVALWPGQEEPAQTPKSDVFVTFRNHLYQGEPVFPARPGGSERQWRVNVSAVGGEGPYIYDGATWVFNPEGQLKGWAHGFESTMVIFDTGSANLPTLEPLPPRESLSVLREALAAGLRDFVKTTGSGKVVVGLSGGLDSALVCLLAVDALGADNVLGVAMPSEYNAPESLDLARDLAKNLGIAFLTIPIDAIRESFAKSFLLTPKSNEKAGNLADENIQARIRSVLLMYLANREDRLLLATGNKSEAAMGYATLYGDTCGAVAPIGDVYKTRLYDLARQINKEREIIPAGIITRPPTAELRPNQKDEDSLPPYPVLDDILHRHLEEARSGSQVAKEGGHSPMTVAWVLSTLKKNAFKRAQEPFSLVASKRPLGGFDWPGR